MDPWVDFHGIDVPGAEPQRDRDIIASPRADDEDVVGRGAHARVWDAIDGHDVELPAGGLDRLVGDAVHQQRDRARRLGDQADLVVRRPAIGCHNGLQAEDGQHYRQRRHLPEGAAPVDEHEQPDGDHRAPYDRWRLEESKQREGHDAGQAAEDVEAICLEWRKLPERARHTLTYQRHHAGHAQEEEGKRDKGGQPRARSQGAEEDEFRAGPIDFDREEPDKPDERGQGDRREAKQIATAVGSQESKTDAEETGQQDEVGEIGEVKDVRPDPSNESQLEKEHQKTERYQPEPRRFGRPPHRLKDQASRPSPAAGSMPGSEWNLSAFLTSYGRACRALRARRYPAGGLHGGRTGRRPRSPANGASALGNLPG